MVKYRLCCKVDRTCKSNLKHFRKERRRYNELGIEDEQASSSTQTQMLTDADEVKKLMNEEWWSSVVSYYVY